MSGHCVLKYDVSPPVMLCQRCGAEQQVVLPMAAKELSKTIKTFSAAHAACEVKP